MTKKNFVKIKQKDQYENMLAERGYEKNVNSPTRMETSNNVKQISCIDHFFSK